MRQTRRRSEYKRVQGAQRTALPFVRIEVPVGGWNTRDSEDNVSPADALEFDNWWPDIGEVRTRSGYSQHCYTGDAVTGSDLVTNGGFEVAGGGSPDIFSSWIEATSDGNLYQTTTLVKAGTYACEFETRAMIPTAYAEVRQQIAVTALKSYRLTFWDTTIEVEGYNQAYLNYTVYDAIGAADIIAWTSTGNSGDEYAENVVMFTAPAGCTSVEIAFRLYVTTHEDMLSYLDVVTLYEMSHKPGSVETLAEYISGSDRHLLAADNGEILNVTNTTPVMISAGGGATYTNDRWQWVNFDGKLGMVNGAEAVVYDNVNVPSLTTYAGYNPGGTPTSIALSGSGWSATPIGCNVFKNRVWYWDANSQDVWYTALNALGGACTKFPLSRVGTFGGNLVLMETWTRDGGSGPDDFAVFVMSSGEAIVYQGSYPGAAGDWALVGIYNIGEPLGYRSAMKFGGDLYIITKLDVVRMSEVLQGIEARQMETKIVPSHRIAVQLYEGNWGWEALTYPKGHMAIFNIPVDENAEMEQHVQNTVTGAWARFKDIVANTWQIFDSDLYFGSSDGKIYKFDDGQDDNEAPIESVFQTAWMPIGGTGGNKLFKAIREQYKTNTTITVNNTFATDFRAFASQNFPVAIPSVGAVWDVSPWDTTPWTDIDSIYSEWQIVGAFGERISMRKKLSTLQRVTVLGFDWLVESGDRL